MPFEFENWAVIALGGIPNKVQVGDMGVDGRIGAAYSLTIAQPFKAGICRPQTSKVPSGTKEPFCRP
jgi:hypothetical protein